MLYAVKRILSKRILRQLSTIFQLPIPLGFDCTGKPFFGMFKCASAFDNLDGGFYYFRLDLLVRCHSSPHLSVNLPSSSLYSLTGSALLPSFTSFHSSK